VVAKMKELTTYYLKVSTLKSGNEKHSTWY
jgi:hypothetical protein